MYLIQLVWSFSGGRLKVFVWTLFADSREEDRAVDRFMSLSGRISESISEIFTRHPAAAITVVL